MKAQSKIGSLDNVKYRPGGGDKKIFDDKDYLRQMSGTTSKAGSEGIPSGSQVTYNQRKHKNWASSETLTYTSSHSLDDGLGKRKAISESSVNMDMTMLPLSTSTNVPVSSSKLHTNEFDLLLLVDSPTESFYNSPTSSTHEERDRDVRYVNNNHEFYSDDNSENDYNGLEMLPKNQYSKSSFDLKGKEVIENPFGSDSYTEPNYSKPESDERNTQDQSVGDLENNNNLQSSRFNHATNLDRNSGENDVIVSEALSQENKTKSQDNDVQCDNKPAKKSEPFDLYDINQLFQDNFNRRKTRSPDSVGQVSKQVKENHIRHEGEDSIEQMFETGSKSDNEHLKLVSNTNNIQDKEVQTGDELQRSANTVRQLLNNFNTVTSNNTVSESDTVLVSSLNSPDKLSGYKLSVTSSSSTENPSKQNRSQSNSNGQVVTNNKEKLFGSVLSMNSNVESDKTSLTETEERLDNKKLEIVPRLKFDENKKSSISSIFSPEPLPRSVDFCKSKSKSEAIVFSLGQSSLVIYKNEVGNEILQIFKKE